MSQDQSSNKESNIKIYFNTFRISKETTALVVKLAACEFWVLYFISVYALY